MSDTSDSGSPMRFRGVDVAVLAGFALYAAIYQLGRTWFVSPFPFLGPDAANLASWAAALDHPERFVGDSTLGNLDNLRFYWTIHVPLIRLLAPLAGDYGTAFISLLGLHVFLQAAGFYLLGCVLLRSRFFAVLLAIVNLMPVEVTLYEQWGTFDDPLPRFTFQALLPFLLAAALASRDRVQRWPWLMLFAGLLMYVHPVSAPPWAFGIWLGLWLWLPPQWSVGRRLATMVALGSVFLLVSAPFLVNYLIWHAHGSAQPVAAAQVREIMETFWPWGYLDAPLAVREFVGLWADARAVFWLWAAAGALLLVRLGRGRLVGTVFLWLLSLLCISVLGPWTEQALGRAYGRLPVQVDLIRGLRYCVPVMLLLCLWPLAELQRSASRAGAGRALRLAAPLGGLLLTAVWSVWHPPGPIVDAMSCWRGGSLVCVPTGWPSVTDALDAVKRETPVGARILPTRLAVPVQVRFYAQRPVVHSRRDLSVLIYANHAALLPWFEMDRTWQAAARQPTFARRFRAHVDVARRLDAQYVLIDSSYFGKRLRSGERYEGQPIVWADERFALLRVEPAPES